MDIEQSLRTLAQSSYWQSLASAAGKFGIQIFENDKDYSGLQVRFLYWVEIYKMLYDQLATHEDEYLSEKVISNPFRCDCYLVYRHKKNDAEWRNHRQEERVARLKNRNPKAFQKDGKHQMIEVDLRPEVKEK